MATFKAIVLKTEKHLKQDGTTNIKIRIYHNGSTQYIATKHYIEPNLLLNSGNITETAPFAEKLNFDLTNTIQEFRSVVIGLGTKRLSLMSCIEVKDHISAAMEPEYEFIDFVNYSQKIIKKQKKGRLPIGISFLSITYVGFTVEEKSILYNEYMEKLTKDCTILYHGTIQFLL
ncbi:Arm DNA-binding domain-containing protein [Dysgonomonas capnocytophagoides]|uniref:Arm DNA-binding domain-containing protein n=1 Tax=Dysgonomonas capnocytophagoides TaxID=45254 RepID=UPI00292739D1|nr:hypothetical protein DCPSUM001_02290 [Dysgonomonas capnocytophagoides]